MEYMEGVDAITQLEFMNFEYKESLAKLFNSISKRKQKLQEYALKDNANPNYIDIVTKELEQDLLALSIVKNFYEVFKKAYQELDEKQGGSYDQGFHAGVKSVSEARFKGDREWIRRQSILQAQIDFNF